MEVPRPPARTMTHEQLELSLTHKANSDAHWAGWPWHRVSQVPTQKLIALRPSNCACACCQNGNWGSKTKVKKRRACQAHAPLFFEWTKLLRFQTRSLVPLSSTPSSSSPSSSSSVCLFFRGGLGVGEKPTCGKLVRSSHRVPSPFISSQRFPFETFR